MYENVVLYKGFCYSFYSSTTLLLSFGADFHIESINIRAFGTRLRQHCSTEAEFVLKP